MKKFTIFNLQFLILAALTLPLPAKASVLFTSSAQENVYVGQSVVIDWLLNTEQQAINLVDFKLNYSTDTLELSEVSSGNSLVSLWVEEPTEVQSGHISLVGGIPGGILGSSVPVFRTVFKAKAMGNGQVSLEQGSKVLLNNGQGTADRLAFNPLSFLVQPSPIGGERVSSVTHPDQTKWYKNSEVKIKFSKEPDKKYSYSFSSNAELLPSLTHGEISEELSFSDLPDGIYYFKVHSEVREGVWQEEAIFRAQIDRSPPEDFLPIIEKHSGAANGQAFLNFSTIDKTSGLKGFEVKLGLLGTFKPADSPLVLRRPLVGDSLRVRAIDRAGNEREVTVFYKGLVSEKVFYIILAALILGGFMVLYIYKFRLSRNKK